MGYRLPRMSRRRLIPILAVVTSALAACQPSTSPSPTAGETSSAAATEEVPPAELVLGCIGIGQAECELVAQQIVATLPEDRGPAFTIQVMLHGCAIPDAPCPQTLAARDGRAIVEFTDGGEPIQLALQGPPQAVGIEEVDASWSGLIQPGSPKAPGPGPFSFDVGHCGISHVVDFDGSFWVPVGVVDGDAPGVLNGETGQIGIVAVNRAQYLGPGGFVVQLARFPGPKYLFLCD
jgi:hypothetical protein